MSKAKIESVRQTDETALFSIIFEGEKENEFAKFIQAFRNDAVLQKDLQTIINVINRMMEAGFKERNFRYEGKPTDNVVALPTYRNRLRLYCLRMSDSVLIVGKGGVKATQKYEQDSNLNGYVISLQKLDELLRKDIEAGIISLEKASLEGIEDKYYGI